LVIAALIARGMRNKEIAREMNVSEATVKMHLHHIYDKLHLNGRTELALLARDLHMPATPAAE
jgi:DNA-binding NarL/FixJ family response regulator